jgi:hypothetical protein
MPNIDDDGELIHIFFDDALVRYFAEELGDNYEIVNKYYGSYIEKIEDSADISVFAETLAEDLRPDYSGDLSEEERYKFHYDLMFNCMTLAWKKMLNEQIKKGEITEEEYNDFDFDDIKENPQ